MPKVNGQPYTNGNSRFATDTNKGQSSASRQACGSVFPGPLYVDPDYSLWLEHVVEWGNPTDSYWLMWYDKSGNPLISVSPILGKKDLQEISKRLADFIVVP
jgi:hypothetical protein